MPPVLAQEEKRQQKGQLQGQRGAQSATNQEPRPGSFQKQRNKEPADKKQDCPRVLPGERPMALAGLGSGGGAVAADVRSENFIQNQPNASAKPALHASKSASHAFSFSFEKAGCGILFPGSNKGN